MQVAYHHHRQLSASIPKINHLNRRRPDHHRVSRKPLPSRDQSSFRQQRTPEQAMLLRAVCGLLMKEAIASSLKEQAVALITRLLGNGGGNQ